MDNVSIRPSPEIIAARKLKWEMFYKSIEEDSKFSDPSEEEYTLEDIRKNRLKCMQTSLKSNRISKKSSHVPLHYKVRKFNQTTICKNNVKQVNFASFNLRGKCKSIAANNSNLSFCKANKCRKKIKPNTSSKKCIGKDKNYLPSRNPNKNEEDEVVSDNLTNRKHSTDHNLGVNSIQLTKYTENYVINEQSSKNKMKTVQSDPLNKYHAKNSLLENTKTKEIVANNDVFKASMNPVLSNRKCNVTINIGTTQVKQYVKPLIFIKDSRTKTLLESHLQACQYTNSTHRLNETKITLSRKEKQCIYTYTKFAGNTQELQQMYKIVNFINQQSPYLAKYILGMRILDNDDDNDGKRYQILLPAVEKLLTILSKYLLREHIENYIEYILWQFEKRRKTKF